MHRSGTSAVAGYLAKAGFFVGTDDELLAPAEDNPRGFFERHDVNALNDELLAELGGAWDKPPERAAVAARAAGWRRRVTDLVEHLAREAGGSPLVLKDPRTCLLLPAWWPLLRDRFALVVVDRNPLDVALSVRRRDGRPLYVALALWQSYCTELLAGLSGQRVLVVHYEQFVRQADQQGPALVGHLAGALGLEPRDLGAASGFVSSGMRHHHTGAGSPASLHALTGAQLALARWMAELPDGWCVLEPPKAVTEEAEAARTAAAEYYDAVADRYGMETAYDTERHRALHFEQATELKDRHIANIESALAHSSSQLEAQAARLEELQAANDALVEANRELRRELAAARGPGRPAGSNLLAAARQAWTGRPPQA